MDEQFVLKLKKKEAKKQPRARIHNLRLAVLKWLWCSSRPSGWALDVPLKAATLKADVVAYWHARQRNKKLGMTLLLPKRALVVLCAENRQACWPECSNPEDILAEVVALREKMQQTEISIRGIEPHLREENVLFEEFAVWDYAKSGNSEYQQMRQRLQNLEKSLYQGTRLDKIAKMQIADEMYLAIPEGEVSPHEVIAGWGLLSVKKDLSVTVLKEAIPRESCQEACMHLIQNMLCASQEVIAAAQGLQITARGWKYVQPPRMRKPRHKPEL